MRARSILATAAAIAVEAAFILPASGQAGFIWAYNRYIDPGVTEGVLLLTYGLPETDAIQFMAQCRLAGGVPHAAIEIGMDIGNLPHGQDVVVAFLAPDFDHSVAGAVIRPDGEGIWGAAITLDLDDPLWQAIQAQPALLYRIAGLEIAKLSLGGSAAPTAQFLQECRGLAGTAPAGKPTAAAPP